MNTSLIIRHRISYARQELPTFSFTFFQSLDSPAQKHTLVERTNCGNVIAEYREAPKDGIANVICLTTGFKIYKEACWRELAEYYYNVAPEPSVKIQHVYFVEVPKGTKSIRTLAALKASPFKQKTFFEYTVNMITEKSDFKKYPFANK